MSAEVQAAIVAAAGSLAVAVFSLVTAGEAKRLAGRAQEAAKRSEQLRLRATAAGESLLVALAELMIGAETLQFLLSHRAVKALDPSEVPAHFGPMGKAAADIRRLVYATAIYTTPEIRLKIMSLVTPLAGGGVDLSQWDQFVAQLHHHHAEVAALFRDTYLRVT